ncbi:extracellular solute-binding protein [Paenibacillaceae bacterium WGS1546]|uniref:extracellular solute-binding protein n=1 Tax=Cohnella sp. WGS1546 TaxID=3366810 RepID=UPI00372D38B9
MTGMRKGLGVLCACMLLLATACGVRLAPEPGGVGTGEATPPGRIVLEFWHTYSDLETAVFTEQVLPLFEEQFPGIAINPVRKDYTDQLKGAVLAAVADNKAPDIMRMDIIWVPEFAKQGVLTRLSGMDGFDELRGQFIGSMLATAEYQGDYYGLPVNANTRAAIFNKTLLRQAGLDAPPRTFDELYAAAKQLKAANPDTYGIGICCSNGWGTLPYFWTFGGQLTDPGYTRASGYLDGEASLAALRRLKLWFDEGIISPSIVGGEPGTWDGILKGKLLMIDDAHWFYTVNASGENEPLLSDTTVGLFPSGEAPGTSVIGGENLVIFAQSDRQEAAWQFVKWMTSERPQQLMADTGLILTNRNTRKANPDPLIALYQEQLARANPRPPVPGWTAVEDVFARMVERIMTGEQPVEEAAAQAAERIDALLRDA